MTVGVTREAGGVGQSAPSIDWPTRLWRRRGLLFGLLNVAQHKRTGYWVDPIRPRTCMSERSRTSWVGNY